MSRGASIILPNPKIANDLVSFILEEIEFNNTYSTFVSIFYCFPKILKKEKRDLDFLQEERIVRREVVALFRNQIYLTCNNNTKTVKHSEAIP